MFFSTGGIPRNMVELLVYLLQSYAIYRLALVRGLPNPIFAFIPFFQLYMLGMVGDSLKYLNSQVDSMFGRIPFSYALPLVSIAGAILRYPFSYISSLVISFAELLIYYLIFTCYARRSCMLYTAVCAIPTLVMILGVLSMLPVFGLVFGLAGGALSLVAGLTSIVGPLLILYCLRRRR